MTENSATAIAHPNIAFIKYWGVRDGSIHLPSNGSISMNLGDLETRISVTFNSHLKSDELEINKQSIQGEKFIRIVEFMDILRSRAHKKIFAQIVSENHFPMSAGLASSASAFAALALAGSTALGLKLSEAELSRLARRGSGSACRSIPAGFVEWFSGKTDRSSFAQSFAPPDYWGLVDCIALVRTGEKMLSSKEGHAIAFSSPLQKSRVADAPRRLDVCRKAISDRDFPALAAIAEADSNWMHAVMMTSDPPLYYWDPATLAVMKAVAIARAEGLPAFYTIDAGPNVHVITLQSEMADVVQFLQSLPEVISILTSKAGGGAHLA
jgi:diphosphomevalonate decarboxylase